MADNWYFHKLLVTSVANIGSCIPQPSADSNVTAGHGGGYYGPNMLNRGNTGKRSPANKYAKDPVNWQRAYDEILRILKAKGGL